MKGGRGAAAVLLVLASTLTASAQEQPPAGSRDESARALHRKGSAAYHLGNFDEAIEAFRAAYSLSPTPGLLFNLAQAYRGKGPGGCADALRTYRAYLQVAPEAPNRALTLEHIADMDRCVRAQTPEPPSGARPDLPRGGPEPAASSSLPWASIVVGGAGIAAAVVGATLVGSSAYELGRLDDRCKSGDCPPESRQPFETQRTAGLALLVGGAALAAGAAVVWLVVPSQKGTSSGRWRGPPAVLRF